MTLASRLTALAWPAAVRLSSHPLLTYLFPHVFPHAFPRHAVAVEAQTCPTPGATT